MLCLAIVDIWVGVSNDAVNFLSSAVGAKAGSKKTIMIVASAGIILGAVTGSGMMDIARNGMYHPSLFNFAEVMSIYLSVVITDIVLLNIFNNSGLPTSTTVSMVFELLGAAFAVACIKIAHNSDLEFMQLLNTDKAFTVITGIFLSVAIAFVTGTVVMYITRLLFSFNITRKNTIKLSIFSALSICAIAYFMLMKGLFISPIIPESLKNYISANLGIIMVIMAVILTGFMMFLCKHGINVLKIVVLSGTFALAMAFAGNDLVNFIGVSFAGISGAIDYFTNGLGNINTFMMTSLEGGYSASPWILAVAGVLMVTSLVFSKNAHKVLQRTVSLSGRNEVDTSSGSTLISRSLVRRFSSINSAISGIVPERVHKIIDKRFTPVENYDDSAFDLLRGSINLVLSGLLIALGTSLKLPLSTTYVTFTIAMGSALSDRAWGRESAVYRLTGVFSVIGGWFVTAGAAFLASALICCLCIGLKLPGMIALIIGAIIYLVKNSKKSKTEQKDESESLSEIYLYSKDKNAVYQAIKEDTATQLSSALSQTAILFGQVFEGFADENLNLLRKTSKNIDDLRYDFKEKRRLIASGIKNLDIEHSLTLNAWFHLTGNEESQMMSTVLRIAEPLREHIDNNFTPLTEEYINEFSPYCRDISRLIASTAEIIKDKDFKDEESISTKARLMKKQLADLRKLQTVRIAKNNSSLQMEMLYLNLITESREILSQLRNILRGAVKVFD